MPALSITPAEHAADRQASETCSRCRWVASEGFSATQLPSALPNLKEHAWARMLPDGGSALHHTLQCSAGRSEECVGEPLMVEGEHFFTFTILSGSGTVRARPTRLEPRKRRKALPSLAFAPQSSRACCRAREYAGPAHWSGSSRWSQLVGVAAL